MKSNNNKKLIISLVVLSIILVVVVGYLVYDKLGTPSFYSYKIGDKVKAKLNNTTEETFYVLSDSSESEEFITLFAEKNIGFGAFNNDYSDGNEYKGSLIETKLNELTSTWSNIKEKRLITVEEIKDTGLTEIKSESRCMEGNCLLDYTYVKENAFFLNLDDTSKYQSYWTMSKVDSSDPATGNANEYVFIVNHTGSIEQHIVGYAPGGSFNKDGKFFNSYGIRPVIVISKKFVE